MSDPHRAAPLPHKVKTPHLPQESHGTANLTYLIFEGLLTGTAGDQFVHLTALSGGGGGSTKHRTSAAVNNPYMEALRTRGEGGYHVHGGPIPPGKYLICKPGRHRHLGLSAQLIHTASKAPMGRDGFYIHGQGPHGSDGCIVPIDVSQFRRLMDLLTQSHGGILWVQEAMNDDRFA